MTVHTAHWKMADVTMSCGHTLTVRAGESHAWCPWCAATVSPLTLAA